MSNYNFQYIEKKWQKKWEEKKIFSVKEGGKKPKFYVLDMFPYPSGEGLHMGHAFVFSLGDIFARFKRLQGYNTLYPIGYDSLGLPAENAAIKKGIHPAEYTKKSMANFMKQQKAMGWSYDWNRLVMAHDPEFYRWDQWIFLQMLKKGLTYRKKSAVNYCSKCQTVLANEQVVGGNCWRHEDTKVEIKQLEQWYLKITDYADELLDGLNKLDWPERAKLMQRNWIGKSQGNEILFEVENNKAILVDAVDTFVIEGKGVFKEMQNLLDKYPNKKIILTNANDEQFKKFELNDLPYEVFTLKHKPDKIDPVYFRKMLENFKLNSNDVIYFEHNSDAIKSAESVGIKSYYYDPKKRDLTSLKKFLDENLNEKWPVFTTRPDTIFGVTFMVVSCQHPKLFELVTKEKKKEVETFLKKLGSVSEKELEIMDKEGVFTGSYAINPMTKEKIPIYAGNFVVADYGSGMVMAVPAHDQRDFDFAKKYNLPIKEVIQPVYINASGSDAYRNNEPKVERKAVVAIIKNPKNNKHLLLQWKKNDWRGFVIGGVEAGEDLLSAAKREIEEETGYTDVKFIRKIEGVVHSRFYHEIKKQNREAHFETLYFELNSDKRKKISEEESKIHSIVWVDEDKVDDFLIRDNDILIIWRKFKGQECYEGSGILVNSKEFNGLDSEEAKEHIIKYLEERKLGKKTVQFKLRDWLISRQRYWGTPIPIVYCDKCGIIPVAEKDLPIKLPKQVKFGKGNPLATNEKWARTSCPKCKGKARRETDTMDTFVNSSWYYLRYTDAGNKKQAFDPKKANYWCPIDQYIGGPEHITMHLIYIRFYAKFLRDLGLLKFDEPALRYFTQGVVKGNDGNRMSKSKGNVVEPLNTIKNYGADSLRLYLISASAPDSDISWDERGIEGSFRFLNKVYEYFSSFKPGKTDARVESKLNKTIKETTNLVEGFKHNLAVIHLRNFFDYVQDKKIDKKTGENFLQLLHIYCPFVTEELWTKIGGKGFISLSSWPKADEKKISLKFEKEEELIDGVVSDINNVKKFVEKASKAYLYVIPNELSLYQDNLKMIEKRTNLIVKVFAVNDSKKHDPENKSKKAKPGKPGIYLE